jgi:D-lactate dehydrogenase (cytochrome)
MRSVKRSLDPYWLMNPGKIFDYSRDSQVTGHAVELDSARQFAAKKNK